MLRLLPPPGPTNIEERFDLAKPAYEQMTPGPHSAGFNAIASHSLSDWANSPSFSFGGKSCEAVTLASQGRGWRAQGVFGRRAAALHAPRLHRASATQQRLGWPMCAGTHPARSRTTFRGPAWRWAVRQQPRAEVERRATQTSREQLQT